MKQILEATHSRASVKSHTLAATSRLGITAQRSHARLAVQHEELKSLVSDPSEMEDSLVEQESAGMEASVCKHFFDREVEAMVLQAAMPDIDSRSQQQRGVLAEQAMLT